MPVIAILVPTMLGVHIEDKMEIKLFSFSQKPNFPDFKDYRMYHTYPIFVTSRSKNHSWKSEHTMYCLPVKAIKIYKVTWPIQLKNGGKICPHTFALLFFHLSSRK